MFKWIGAFGVNVRAAATVIAVIVATTALAVAGQDFPKNGIVKNGARQEAPVDRYIDLKPSGVPTGASASHVALVQRLEVAISDEKAVAVLMSDRRRHDTALQHAPQVMGSSVRRQPHSEQGQHPPAFRQPPPKPRQDGPV